MLVVGMSSVLALAGRTSYQGRMEMIFIPVSVFVVESTEFSICRQGLLGCPADFCQVDHQVVRRGHGTWSALHSQHGTGQEYSLALHLQGHVHVSHLED